MDYSKHVSTKQSHQMERSPGRTDEVANSEGGFVFAVDDWTRLDRFLILGSEGGTFYISEKTLTKDNAEAVLRLIAQDGLRVVNRAVEISQGGRAPSNDPALFVLALAAKLGNETVRKHALNVMPSVARIGTHLFTFLQYIDNLGGWGRATKRAVQRWYTQKKADSLANQLLKYRQRNGWSHRDVLRLAHPKTEDAQLKTMFDVTCRPEKAAASLEALPRLYAGYVMAANDEGMPAKDRAALVRDYKLTREMLPTEWLKDPQVWTALLEDMPYIATVRNLGVMTANQTLKPLSENTQRVIERIKNRDLLKGSRMHPLNVLLAQKTYAMGHGLKGSLSWKVDSRIVDALDEAFYMAFDNVEATGKNFLIGVDVSSSMTAQIAGKPISAAEAAGALAMVTARTEPKCYVHGFTAGRGSYYGNYNAMDGFVDLGVTPRDTLAVTTQKVSNKNFGRTDCSIPMRYATKMGIKVDCFIVITDNETYAGDMKPVEALRKYRRKVNPSAKSIVIATTSNGFTIADPTDAGMLDIVGFDTAIPTVIRDFVVN